MAKTRKKFTLELSDALDSTLENMADEQQTSKSDLLRRAIQLLQAVSDEHKKDRKLAFIDNDENIIKEIVVIG